MAAIFIIRQKLEITVNDDMSDENLYLTVEDRFLIFPLRRYQTGAVCPVTVAERFAEFFGEYVRNRYNATPIIDLRGLDDYYDDVDDFVGAFALMGVKESGVCALVAPNQSTNWAASLDRHGIPLLKTNGPEFSGTDLQLGKFVNASGWPAEEFMNQAEELLFPQFAVAESDYVELNLDVNIEERDDLATEFAIEGMISRFNELQRHSLLVEFAMQVNGDRLTLHPYHGHAIHNIEVPSGELLVGRPGVFARNTGAVFSEEIREFEDLINAPQTTELQLQRFLEKHCKFLTGLNYQNVYPQIVLEREGDGPLKPDFVLEPYKDGFCDILDLKLPRQKLFVGKKDRAALAAGLHEVAAQLREYAAYFEEEKYRTFVRQKYGLRVYRPRLIAIVGRDMQQMNDEQLRRAMTAYEGLSFLTFDELLKHVKRRVLI